MCPLFEELCAIIGSDPNAPLVRNEIKVGHVRLFADTFNFSLPKANKMIANSEKVALIKLVDRFREPNLDDLDYMCYCRRALVFCLIAGFLFNRNPGFGDLSLCPLLRQMEEGHCIGELLLAETIRSLERAALGFTEWTVTPLILQVFSFSFYNPFSFLLHHLLTERIIQQIWLKDHLKVVAPSTRPNYDASHYRTRRIVVEMTSVDAWITWLL